MLNMALARPPQPRTPGKHYGCNSFNIPITVTDAPTLAIPILPVQDQYQAVNALSTLTSRTPSDWQIHPQLVNISGTYNTVMQHCFPVDQPVSTTLQLLTHGIGFNASYWDFYLSSSQGDAQYSYINSATAAGYSTLAYNRLGIMGSGPADPNKEVQPTVQVAILARITQLAREGKLFDQLPKPSKIVHVGHSYGSIITNVLAAQQPSLSDGIVLTGYSALKEYASLFLAASTFTIASSIDPTRFPPSQYPSGYATWPSKWPNQYAFFAYPNFDPLALDQVESTKAPFTMAEFFSMPLLTTAAPDFQSPVLYVNAERDQVMCGANCTGVVGPGTTSFSNFNGTTDIESVIIAGAGHGLAQHYGADKGLCEDHRLDEEARVLSNNSA